MKPRWSLLVVVLAVELAIALAVSVVPAAGCAVFKSLFGEVFAHLPPFVDLARLASCKEAVALYLTISLLLVPIKAYPYYQWLKSSRRETYQWLIRPSSTDSSRPSYLSLIVGSALFFIGWFYVLMLGQDFDSTRTLGRVARRIHGIERGGLGMWILWSGLYCGVWLPSLTGILGFLVNEKFSKQAKE